MANALPSYRNFNELYAGNPYCLQCCGGGTDVDYWNLRCVTSDGGPVTNMYGYEVRFARNKFPGDIELVWCPIRRSVCTFNDTTQSDLCDENLVKNDLTWLHGITIELHVKMNYYAQQSWRQVTGCSVTADERNYSLPIGSDFEENYIMHHEIAHYTYDPVSLFFLFIAAVVLLYAALYYCRRQRCYVCEKKLVLFKDRCYLCRFYGAHMPDPVLIRALEEKAKHEQGEYPQKFWCSKRVVKFCRGLAGCCEKMSRCMTYVFCCQCCCCCCKPRGEKCKLVCCSHFCCCLYWCESVEEIHPDDVDPEKADHLDMNDELSMSTTATTTRKKKVKVNPYLIRKHPFIIETAIGHPHPVEPPKWIKHRNLNEEFDDRDSTYTISTKKTAPPRVQSSGSGLESVSSAGSGSDSEESSSEY